MGALSPRKLDNQKSTPPGGGIFCSLHAWYTYISFEDLTMKTLKTFVDSISSSITLDGKNDYKNVDAAAKEYFGHAIPNAQVWKVINALQKAQPAVEVLDDL